MMKAWKVTTEYEPYVEIVFAETRGQARSLGLATDSFENYSFTEIRVRRIPQMDKYYKGYKNERLIMDWENPKDRLAMVKDGNLVCSIDYEDDCEQCCAKEFCDIWR